MGYYSDIVIAISKKVLALDLITPVIPDVLKNHSYKDYLGNRYWIIEQWKWYDDYPDIQDILTMFEKLDLETEKGKEALYGAVRIGEDTMDTDEWGDPFEFDIQIKTSIDSPVQ